MMPTRVCVVAYILTGFGTGMYCISRWCCCGRPKGYYTILSMSLHVSVYMHVRRYMILCTGEHILFSECEFGPDLVATAKHETVE